MLKLIIVIAGFFFILWRFSDSNKEIGERISKGVNEKKEKRKKLIANVNEFAENYTYIYYVGYMVQSYYKTDQASIGSTVLARNKLIESASDFLNVEEIIKRDIGLKEGGDIIIVNLVRLSNS